MAYRGARLRTRCGRGRGFVPHMANNGYKRSDQNMFEVLSGLQDGDDDDCIDMSTTVDEEGFTIVRKRQSVNTGGTENVLQDTRYKKLYFTSDTL